jgi:diguanylate cyclase (GGDEF)-like protein/PAS domain S-box-containing protein
MEHSGTAPTMVCRASVTTRGPAWPAERAVAQGALERTSEPLDPGIEWSEVVATLPQIVWVTRPDGYHVYFNQQWMDFTGLTLEESVGDGWNPPFHPDDRPLARQRWAEATRTGRPYEIEYRLRRHDGVYRWMLGRAVPVRDGSGQVVKWFGTCTDIEELKVAIDVAAALRTELERRASHDPLTGLPNRDLLFARLDQMLDQRPRAGIAVAFIDLDRFKAVNDRLGHRAGDQLLVHVAEQLRGAVRRGDVAARIGGDEFAVVGAADGPEDAQHLGRRLADALCGTVALEGVPVEVAASLGVTFIAPGERSSSDEALARADVLMYEAKRGR